MNGFEWFVPSLLTIVTAATPLVFAAVGEIVAIAPRSGVVNQRFAIATTLAPGNAE